MAGLQIPNPSITSGAFASMLAFSSDNNTITAISGHPIAGVGGGGTPVEGYWRPSVNNDGDISWQWSLESTATAPSTANIKGPQGIQGETGPRGPSGTNGTNGTNGISPTFTIAPTAGGTHVTISGAQGEESFDVLSGAKGADGTAGFSPLFTITDADTGTYPQGGKHVAIQYGDGGLQNTAFDILNGIDGTGATVNIFGGNGIGVTQAGSNYTLGLSGGVYVPSLSAGYADYSNYALSAYLGNNTYLGFDKFVTKPTSLVNKYLVLRTDDAGNVSGWCDFQDQSYSKGEADRTFVATANIDTTTLSGNGKSSSTKLGVKTDVIATIDYVNNSFLPTSGGTVSGQLTISGSSFNNNLQLKRGNYEGFIGLASNGAITLKNNANGSTSQIEFLTSDSKTFDITVKDNSSTPQSVGKLYVMSAHSIADASATSASWANDGMLHIILES